MKGRGAGVNIPVFSLRTKNSLGCGELLDLIPLIDWAVEAGLKLIQILPINDTSITETKDDAYPYSILSTFALHPIYLNVQALGPEFSEEFAPIIRTLNLPKLDYQKTYLAKKEILKMLFAVRGEKDLSTKAFAQFFEKQKEHLKPYAAFCVLRDQYRTSDFRKWKKHSMYCELATNEICEQEEVKYYYFLQYHLDKQMRQVHAYAEKKGILLKGDFAMGVHPNSVEAWRFQEYFYFDKSIGAPPDFYNASGQNWGFPSYNWEEIRAEGFYWLKARLKWMEQYFDVVRIDHVLGYFRLWEIPEGKLSGLMGNFYPAIGYDDIPEPGKLTSKAPSENVCFFKREGKYHPRINCRDTACFKALDQPLQKKVLQMHDEYFLAKQEDLWREEGREKLKFMQKNTKMLICVEDIGVIPKATEEVIAELDMLNLYVQRMPKSFELEFEDPEDFPTRCVCTPSNHDTATLREWWERAPESTKRYYNTILHHTGDPPKELTEDLAKEIVQAHLNAKPIWAIFLLQDLLAMSEAIRFPDPKEQRINNPAKPKDQWQWRMHLYIEELLLANSFTEMLHKMIKEGRR
ncbi:MAG: 4-alpha-glucanotransferase [Simkaniaceae bacterium]|nr:4-alpha-glucanotransferase [Candidatus Sacchlamyda saccharinae]